MLLVVVVFYVKKLMNRKRPKGDTTHVLKEVETSQNTEPTAPIPA